METRFLDTLRLKGRKSGIIFAESGQKWVVSQEIKIIPQGNMHGFFSQRVGGNLRVLTKDGTLKASWNNTAAGAQLTAEEANIQAVDRLADSALPYLMLCLLEETNDRRKQK
ncbi:MAG: hypothetical protein KKH28_11825 [Elusimicrobia bacterium]|nr:hypothetical protein [Elusimicrobiota bacterium]